MLLETAEQFWIACSFIWLGIFLALIQELFCFRFKKEFWNYVVKIALWTGFGALFFVWVSKFAFANLRLYCFLSTLLGFIVEYVFLHNLLANRITMLYNTINRKIKVKLEDRKKRSLDKKLKRLSMKDNRKKKKAQRKEKRRNYDRKKIKKPC